MPSLYRKSVGFLRFQVPRGYNMNLLIKDWIIKFSDLLKLEKIKVLLLL